MTQAANLRLRARELRDMAALCRRRGTALSLILDRTKMRGHATELETRGRPAGRLGGQLGAQLAFVLAVLGLARGCPASCFPGLRHGLYVTLGPTIGPVGKWERL